MTRIERVERNPTHIPLLDLCWVPDGWWRLLTDQQRREGVPARVKRRHFEACVFSQLMLELKAGDLLIVGSDAFADYREQIADYGIAAGVPVDAAPFVEHVRSWLDGLAKSADGGFPENKSVRREGMSLSGSMCLRLVRSYRSSSVCELTIRSRGRGVSTNARTMSSQPNSIDARAVLVTDANGSPTKSASAGRQTATRKARPSFATIGNAGADEPSGRFGDLLRDHRRVAGLTQEQLAERAGVSQRSISDMERGGEHVPRRDTVRLLVRALGLTRLEREVFEGLVERGRRLRPMPDRPAIYPAPLITERVVERPKHNLPRSLTSLVGREQELAELGRVLATAPLLTLVGAGGIGKTRLAQQLVRNHVASYPNGSWLIELAPLADPSLVPGAVAAALGLHDIEARSITTTLVEYLRPLKLLLVLDNCEHLVEPCAELVATLLGTCPQLQVVATSREPLAIAGEVTWRVPPLGLPEPYAQTSPDQIMHSASVRLFIERAQAVNNALVLTPDNLPQIARICIGVDGIPLALELAAAHARVLPVEQLADRLEYDAEVLGRTIRTSPPRHQTMRATLDWSHQLLGDQERALLRRLSVFARGWTLRFAEVVCSGAGINAAHVLCLMTRLVDKSMVMVDTSGALGRYRLLEPIRHYALERLEASGEATRYRARHAAASRYFAQIGEAAPVEPTEISSRDQLEAEYDDLRIALRWALTKQESAAVLRCTSALFHFWELRGHFQAGCASVQQVLAPSDDGPALYPGRALNALTALYCRRAHIDSAQPIAG